MSAHEITKTVLDRLARNNDDFILINYANGDMVGHTGNLAAAIEAIEVLDDCVGRVVKAVLERQGTVVITSDHGNIEEMVNAETGMIDKEHSTNPVPCWFVAPDNRRTHEALPLTDLTPQGMLADVAPTILGIMGIPQPLSMTGLDLRRVITTCRLPK
jgi:2,3-bisphosphoglycerate-independent phosphoglycerate mutase